MFFSLSPAITRSVRKHPIYDVSRPFVTGEAGHLHKFSQMPVYSKMPRAFAHKPFNTVYSTGGDGRLSNVKYKRRVFKYTSSCQVILGSVNKIRVDTIARLCLRQNCVKKNEIYNLNYLKNYI